MSNMEYIVLADDGLVVATFLDEKRATDFCSVAGHTFCMVPHKHINGDGRRLLVGDIYKA